MTAERLTAKRLTAAARRFLDDESGTTAIEYSLIATGIAVAIIATVQALGTGIKTNLWDKVGGAL